MAEAERVTKVGYYKERVTIEHVRMNKGSEELISLPKCRDVPTEDFKNAFASLIPLALKVLDLQDNTWMATAVVSSVHIGRDGKGRRNFVLTVIRPLAHGVATVNTPVRLEKEGDESGPQFATDELTKAIDRACALGRLYWEGAREQLALALPEAEPATE